MYIFDEMNQEINERYRLSEERIRCIQDEFSVDEVYRNYFVKTSRFLTLLMDTADMISEGRLKQLSLDELQQLNKKLYEDILPENYAASYAAPDFAVAEFGSEIGRILSFLYTEIRSVIPRIFENRLFDITVVSELFIGIYNIFEEKLTNEELLRELNSSVYYYAYDYCEDYYLLRVQETSDPVYSFAKDIIMDSDLSDPKYLYYYGEYITQNEIETVKFLNSMSEEDVSAMAATYTDGYCRGFKVMQVNFDIKQIIMVRYNIGFERVIRKAIENFENIGKKVCIPRSATGVLMSTPAGGGGFAATGPNQQFRFDHRFDMALYLDSKFVTRRLECLKNACETYKIENANFAGPAVMMVFGMPDFSPSVSDAVLKLDSKQNELYSKLRREAAGISAEYVKHDETSYTIIAYPVPSIGPEFKNIFADTVKVNNLNNELYKGIQQSLIAALDKGSYCRVTGRGNNRTDLKIMLHKLKDTEKETNFENCTADVNIPVGEVFTSPVLTGTEGILYVSKVFLNGYSYKDLTIEFRDGIICDYSCTNFEGSDANREFISENLLMNQQTLAMGEFAIGTNTTAYMVGRKYSIQEQLPILIAEKTGPHFAIGDTCYARSEEHKMYNPDGKEVIARENEVSMLRHTDPEKAYFNCHTDITIPYNELDRIEVWCDNGTSIVLIDNGRFVLPGTEELNKAFDA